MKTQFSHERDYFEIRPEEKLCKICKYPLTYRIKKENGLLLLNVIMNCRIYVGTCNNIECANETEVTFDGCLSGYINFKNSFIIGIELVQEYMDLFSVSGLPFVSWWVHKVKCTKNYDEPLINVERNWRSYAGSLHEAFSISSEKIHFNSNACCVNPDVILMDGVVISVKSERLPKFHKPWKIETVVNRVSTREDRQFKRLDDNYIELVKKFITTGVTENELGRMKSIDHLGLLCLISTGKQKNSLFQLDKRSINFGTFLIKNVASIKSLVPVECVDCIKRYLRTIHLI